MTGLGPACLGPCDRARDPLHLAHMILDDEALQILRWTSDEAMTAREVSRRSEIPMLRCLRWLRTLESHGFLRSREWPAGRNGVRSRVYASALRSIGVQVEDDRIATRIELTADAVPVVLEWMTTEGSATTDPSAPSSRRTSGGDVVHFIDPPRPPRGSRPRFRITLPAFLQEPLPQPPERR